MSRPTFEAKCVWAILTAGKELLYASLAHATAITVWQHAPCANLQQLLLPMMAPDGRIVNLASRAHKHTRCLQFDKSTGQLSHHPWHWWAALQMATMLDGTQMIQKVVLCLSAHSI